MKGVYRSVKNIAVYLIIVTHPAMKSVKLYYSISGNYIAWDHEYIIKQNKNKKNTKYCTRANLKIKEMQ